MQVGSPGIWLVFRKTQTAERGEESRLVGRFAIVSGNITVLEDHDGIVGRVFPNGPMTGRELQRMRSMSEGQSAYWDICSEADIEEGNRPDLTEEMDLEGNEWAQEGQE